MADYRKSEARAWAQEHLVGCSAVTIPTFTADLKGLNEDATSSARSSTGSPTPS